MSEIKKIKNRFLNKFLFVSLTFTIGLCFGQEEAKNKRVTADVLSEFKALNRNIDLGLNYLEKTQRKETISETSYRGEWKTTMGLRGGFFLLGVKKKVDDSNCFSVASIHNSLAQIYLKHPEYTSILPMLDLSFEKIMSYKNGNQFNFWNLLPPNRKLQRGDVIGCQPLVRRPTNYKLRSRYINNAANVVEDADDTSLAYSALALRKKIYTIGDKTDTLSFVVENIAPIFEKYKDVNRKNRHWYNYLYGHDKETGAYLTWLGDEYEFKRWNIIKTIGHNATFFLPFSECFPHAYVPYIPYGSNDLDGVVNANVLAVLALYNELDAPGVSNAISYIEKKSELKKFDRVGIYYPNRYQFPYAVSEAYINGVIKLKPSAKFLIEFLIDTQNEDGSWDSRRVINKKDQLQSAAYGLNALLNFGDIEHNNTLEPIQRAITYILSQAKYTEDSVFWDGGVFFSGGTVVRNTLFWQSDAYTTAIILKAFANYKEVIELKYPTLAF